jgi:hypothetical protein
METFGPASDLETGSIRGGTEQPLMLESSVATTSDYGAPAALLQVYSSADGFHSAFVRLTRYYVPDPSTKIADAFRY